jgi:antitoxin (DNA-binding transcriptional repressor) of toxin-antitoxin stability system
LEAGEAVEILKRGKPIADPEQHESRDVGDAGESSQHADRLQLHRLEQRDAEVLSIGGALIRADQFSSGQRSLKDLKKAVSLANDRFGWLEFMLQRQPGLRIREAKDSLTIQQFDQVKFNSLVIEHQSYSP